MKTLPIVKQVKSFLSQVKTSNPLNPPKNETRKIPSECISGSFGSGSSSVNIFTASRLRRTSQSAIVAETGKNGHTKPQNRKSGRFSTTKTIPVGEKK